MPLFLLSQTHWVRGYIGDKEEKTWDGGQVHRKQRDVNSATHEEASFDFYQPALKKKTQNTKIYLLESRKDLPFYEFGVGLSPLTICVQFICYAAQVMRYSSKSPLGAGIGFRVCVCLYICCYQGTLPCSVPYCYKS